VSDGCDDLSALAALADPARRALYDYVVSQDHPVSRDDAADALDLKRPTAAFHLERLAEAGLLDVSFARLTGRSGPGAGRPAKLYARATREIEISLPPRHYDLAGQVLAAAIEAAAHGAGSVHDAVGPIAHAVGAQAARGGADLSDVLTRAGYEPQATDDGDVVLANCPFHSLARQHTELVCGMNLQLLRGILDELGAGGEAVLDPAPDRCCVRLRGLHPPVA
jgi:predicted ArsR family transcriptional regulator